MNTLINYVFVSFPGYTFLLIAFCEKNKYEFMSLVLLLYIVFLQTWSFQNAWHGRLTVAPSFVELNVQ